MNTLRTVLLVSVCCQLVVCGVCVQDAVAQLRLDEVQVQQEHAQEQRRMVAQLKRIQDTYAAATARETWQHAYQVAKQVGQLQQTLQLLDTVKTIQNLPAQRPVPSLPQTSDRE